MSSPSLSHSLPELPYDYSALEPIISSEIMRLHHTKHHQNYVNNLNTALEKTHQSLARGDLSGVIAQQKAIRFNGGGHLNHSIFWSNLAPPNQGGGAPPGEALAEKIGGEFGGVSQLIEKMSQAAIALQGSGWAWLGYDKGQRRLIIATCDNQDPLIMQGYTPLLGIDVWEHAYYSQYKNARADYVHGIWNLVNWQNVADRFAVAEQSGLS